VNAVVSIITPVYRPSPEHLWDAYRSIASQKMPPGWEWEWIVQEDDEPDTVSSLLPDDPRIISGAGRHGGPGVARTIALGRARGGLVKVLDGDDMLTDGALERDIGTLARFPDIGWTTSRVVDLLADGSTAGFEHDPPDGRIPRGAVLQHWRSHDYRAQVHPATLCLRRELLLALGGWMALPASEDTGLLLCLDAVTDGYFMATAGLVYRKWPGQATNQTAHVDPIERAARMRVIEARAEVLRETWRLVPATSPSAARRVSLPRVGEAP
jgi:hypothetical protein